MGFGPGLQYAGYNILLSVEDIYSSPPEGGLIMRHFQAALLLGFNTMKNFTLATFVFVSMLFVGCGILENMTPEQFQQVENTGKTVGKVIGDTMMGVTGVPEPVKEPVSNFMSQLSGYLVAGALTAFGAKKGYNAMKNSKPGEFMGSTMEPKILEVLEEKSNKPRKG